MADSIAERPRVFINNNHSNLVEFAAYVEALKPLNEIFDLRVAISHHHKLKLQQIDDPTDPYLFYAAGFASFYDFVVPDALAEFSDSKFVAKNMALMLSKHAILEKAGMGAGFIGLEPVYYPEAVFQKYPEWRGPRIDHPRRSHNPRYAMCMHQLGVRELYAEMARRLVEACPLIDTFYFWSDDSGSGFCWNPNSYYGANGPAACQNANPIAAWHNFQTSVLHGARAGGAQAPMSIVTRSSHYKLEAPRIEGAFEVKTDEQRGRLESMGADIYHTYPVNNLFNPYIRSTRWTKIFEQRPQCSVIWLSDVYHCTALDTESVKDLVAMIVELARQPAACNTLTGKVALLNRLAASRFRPEAAESVVDGWDAMTRAFQTESENFSGAFFTNPTYLGLSHRWLVRPLVAFESRLPEADRKHYLPFIFNRFGELGKSELLDVHGKTPLSPASDYTAFDSTANAIGAHYTRAAEAFDIAAKACTGRIQMRLLEMSHSCRILVHLWRNVRNGLQFALLRKNAHEKPMEEIAEPVVKGGAPIGWLPDFHKILLRTVRDEIDNTSDLIKLLESPLSRGFHTAATADQESTFAAGPDFIAQLHKKRALMLEHLQDLYLLYPNESATVHFRYWFP